MSKPMTAAEYKQHAQQVRANESVPTEIHTCKSGSVWELRRPDLKKYVFAGRLPHNFLLKGRMAWKDKLSKEQLAEQLVNKLSDKEFLDSMEFMANLLSDITVNPHIAYPVENENDIDPLDVLEADSDELMVWLKEHMGVPGVSGLETFRKGRKRNARNKSHSTAIQPEAVSTATN